MGKFIGIDEILQGGTPNRPTHSTPKEGKKGEALARTSLEYPLELHRKVKKYAVDAGMKEKQVIAQAIYNPQNHLAADNKTTCFIFPLKQKTKRLKKRSKQHTKSVIQMLFKSH